MAVGEQNWQEVKLGDLAEYVTVGYVGPMAHEYLSSGIPFLRSQDIKPYRIDVSDITYISETFHEKIKKSALQPGDVVIVRTGRPGTSAVIPESLSVANCSDMVIVRPGTNLDSRFLCYYINSIAQDHVSAYSVGAVQQHYNVGSAKELKILLPPLPEQQAIARILGALDDKIELNRRMNHTLEEMARTLFKSWFVDFDPVTAKAEGRVPYGMNAETASLFPAEFEETGDDYFYEIPKGWTLKNLDDVADYENGLALQKFRPEGIESLPAIKIRELRQGFADESSDRVSPNIKASCILEDGDVVFSWSGSLMIDLWCGGKGALNQHLFKVTSGKYPKWFYYFWTEHHLVDFQDIAEGKATTMGHIQRHHLTSAKVVVPSDDILGRADKTIAPLLDSIIKNRVQNKTLITIRDSLLPKLMSGEVSVRNGALGGVA